jgi:hypothetical protein
LYVQETLIKSQQWVKLVSIPCACQQTKASFSRMV